MEKQVTDNSVTCFVLGLSVSKLPPPPKKTKLRSTCGRPASLAECGIAHLWRGLSRYARTFRPALFAQWACKGPCGKQKGKALSGATIGSVVANPSLSAEWYRADDFLSRLFCLLDYVRVMPYWCLLIFWIFKINAGEKRRKRVFLFSSASFFWVLPTRK